MSKQYSNKKNGVLHIVATPIGNLEDITYRAVKVLGKADLIAAEDTRRAKILLSNYGINTPLTSFYSAHQSRKTPAIIGKLRDGLDVAIISEAGTPGISDPGNMLVAAARAEGIDVIPIPGPAAVTSAISVAGLQGQHFAFLGFLAPKGSKRNKAIRKISEIDMPAVIYESPHRIKRTLNELLEKLGDRPIFIAREMTKIHEEYLRTTLSEAVALYEETQPRGEFTIIIFGQ